MKTTSNPADLLRDVLFHASDGVVGLVDDLLTICQTYGLQLDWQFERCHLRSMSSDWEESIDVPLRRSVFRAVLARVAVLCNERKPDSVSPYGGHGELRGGGNPPAEFSVNFVNTPEMQQIELRVKANAR